MKILIFYTPRSKSTMLHNMLCKRYNLLEFGDTVTKSRIKNKDFSEYTQLITKINSTNNICVKLNGNDFIDCTTGNLTDLYKTVDYQSFDKIIFLTRKNYIDAILSYGYMDPTNSNSWHRRKDQTVQATPYTVTSAKIYHLLNGYRAYDSIKDYIKSQVTDPNIIRESEFEELSRLISELQLENVDIDLAPMDIDYKSIVTNYDEIVTIATQFFTQYK